MSRYSFLRPLSNGLAYPVGIEDRITKNRYMDGKPILELMDFLLATEESPPSNLATPEPPQAASINPVLDAVREWVGKNKMVFSRNSAEFVRVDNMLIFLDTLR